MAQVLTSISGLPISAASAGYAPTNSGDVSAIASGYQVVSSTATQLYAGTAFLTGVNGDPISASRAGQAANASMANSAYYDGTGRLISSLPDSATVSSIASSYAESAVSGVVDTVSSNSASWASGVSLPITGSAGDESGIYDANYVEFTRYDTAGEPDIRTARLTPDYFSIDYTLDGNDYTSMMLSDSMLSFTLSDGTRSVDAYSIDTWNSAVDTVANNSATWGAGVDSATVSAIASAYQVVSSVGDDGTYITSINGSALSGVGGGATGDYVEKSATEVSIGSNNSATTVSFAQGSTNSAHSWSLAQGYGNSAKNYSFVQGQSNRANNDSFAQGYSNSASFDSFAQGYHNSASSVSFAQGQYNSASSVSFAQGQSISAINTAAVFGTYNLHGNGSTSTGDSAAFAIGDGTASNARHDLMLVTKDGEITMYSSTADTVGTGIMSSIRAISAAATGGGVDSATVSAIASSYAESAASGKLDSSASSSFYTTANESGYVDSAYVGSAVGSAVSSYQPLSGMSAYESSFSAGDGLEFITSGDDRILQVDTPVDIVAGPGIVIDNPDGNTMRVSVAQAEEVVLWEDANGKGAGSLPVTLSEKISNFERVRFVYAPWATDQQVAEFPGNLTRFILGSCWSNSGTTDFYSFLDILSVSGTSLSFTVGKFIQWGVTSVVTDTAQFKLYKVVGIHRTASN